MGMIGFVIVGDDLSNLDSIKSIKYVGKSKKVAPEIIAQIKTINILIINYNLFNTVKRMYLI